MQSQANIALFERMPVPKAAMKLMLPTIIGSLVTVLYSLADTFFVGLINDPIQNAAVALAMPVMLAFNAVNNLFGIGSSSMMSRALGRKDFTAVRQGAAFGFYCSVGCGIIFSLLCLIFFNPLLRLLGATSETLSATADYMLWTVLWGATPSILNVVFAYLVRAEGESFHASIGTMSGCLLNIVLDPIFILPWGFNMGAAGAGLATFISNGIACAYFFVLLLVKRGRTFVSINIKDFSIKKELVREVCGVGVPASIQNLLNVVGMTLLNNFTAVYGANAVAAMGIAHKIYMVPVQVAMGGSQGIMPLVSYCYSSRNNARFKAAIRFVQKSMLPAMTVIGVACWLLSRQLVGLFIGNPEVIEYGVMFLRADCFAMPFLVADFLVVGVMQAIGSGKTTLFFAVCRKILLEIPAMIVLNWVFQAAGIAYCAFVAEAAMSLIGAIALRRVLKEQRGLSV